MTDTFIPPIPSTEDVRIPREALELLALVDLTRTGRRVLDILMSQAEHGTGVAQITQREMTKLLGASLPAVNRGFREIRKTNLAWPVADGRYQLHPLLTGGATESLTAVPEIKGTDPSHFAELRRQRYTVQSASLSRSA